MGLHKVLNNLYKKSRNRENIASLLYVNMLSFHMSSIGLVYPLRKNINLGEGLIFPEDSPIYALSMLQFNRSFCGVEVIWKHVKAKQIWEKEERKRGREGRREERGERLISCWKLKSFLPICAQNTCIPRQEEANWALKNRSTLVLHAMSGRSWIEPMCV